MLTQSQAYANWLSLCHQQPAASSMQKNDGYLAHYLAPDESISILQLTKQSAGTLCKQVELSINVQDVLWAGFATNTDAATLALQGVMRNEHFLVGEVIYPEPPQTPNVERVKKPPRTARTTGSPTKSAWFWSPGLWMDSPEKIFNVKSTVGLNRIYITVPTNNGEVSHPTELRQFIQKAHAQHLQVWAVLGDPRAVTYEGVAKFITASAAYAAFNEESIQAEKLEGLQLDIEPYLIPGYSQDPAVWLSKYAYVVNNIHYAVPDLPIDIVLPFWFDPATPVVATMLDDVADSISRITVMDYRTNPEQIRAIAAKFLDWGAHHQKTVDIALETLPMAQEERRHYQRAAGTGELWQLNLGDKSVLLLLKTPHPSDAGVTSYHFTHSRLIDGTDISFYTKIDSLKPLINKLEADLSVWPSYSGLAIHGLDYGLMK